VVALDAFPASQNSQVDEEGSTLKRPVAQLEQTESPGCEKRPAAQALQVVEESAPVAVEMKPDGHGRHALTSLEFAFGLNRPVVHREHTDAAAPAYRPGTHS
jgi:hypothetical protein